VDKSSGTQASQAGWNFNSTDKQLSTLGINGSPFSNIATTPWNANTFFVPSVGNGQLRTMISTTIADFPLFLFNGNNRTLPGGPGANY
ncbi:MAG: hypothetical protein LBS48_02800, partial [Treponema sp.]|jgi:hypothetical protein|nr:hypothetical protein [Treponema sp.]